MIGTGVGIIDMIINLFLKHLHKKVDVKQTCNILYPNVLECSLMMSICGPLQLMRKGGMRMRQGLLSLQ